MFPPWWKGPYPPKKGLPDFSLLTTTFGLVIRLLTIFFLAFDTGKIFGRNAYPTSLS